MAGAEAAHRHTAAVPVGGQGGDAIAAGAKTLGGRMQAPRRRADPAQDDLAPSIGKAADPTRKIPHKSKLALLKRHLLQWVTIVVDGPTWKGDGHGGYTIGRPVLQRQQSCQDRKSTRLNSSHLGI